ncbi:MAG: hypothetical protein LW806_09160 [Planctomycetaceae bacterium]|nr:hypothetical protein [Planctomycetaceae bacterium]
MPAVQLTRLSVGVFAAMLASIGSTSGAATGFERLSQGEAARADDFLGRSVSTDGARIAAGVPEHDAASGTGTVGGAGAIAIFERVTGTWTRTALLTASDAATADVLGECVALDGDLLIASAANVGLLTPAPWTGAAYIFERGAGGWIQRAKLVPPNPSEFMEAGLASAIDGETRTAVVAARLDDDVATDAGSVAIYRELGGSWTLVQELHAPDAIAGDAFGYRVAIDGDVLAVATPATDALAESTGSVYVFERIKRGAGPFVFRAKLMAADAAYRDRFGTSVAVDGSTIVVGAVGDDNLAPGGDQGAAYVFWRVDGAWSQMAKLVAGDRQPLDGLGASVSVLERTDGTLRVAAGASSANQGAGAVYLFEGVPEELVETAKYTAPTGAANDGLGASTSLAGPLLVTGAERHDFPLANAGAAYALSLAAPCPADLDGDGAVGAADLSLVLLAWGSLGLGNPADLNGDGAVGAADLSLLLESWGACG